MSVYAIGHAFQVHLPPREKFVLVALADNADHAGSCYPSLETLAGKTSMSVRTVQRALRDLETLGALVVERHGGRSVEPVHHRRRADSTDGGKKKPCQRVTHCRWKG